MNDLEQRLSDAFTARADLVTADTLRRDAAPAAPPRRLPRWTVPTIAGLAVAAAAAGLLVATGPGRPQQAPPAKSTPSPAVVDPSRVSGAGWKGVLPPTWERTTGPSKVPGTEYVCLGTTPDPCQVMLGRTAEAAKVRADAAGANVVDLGDAVCRVTRPPRPSTQQGIQVVDFDCGADAAGGMPLRQLVVAEKGMVAVALAPGGRLSGEVLATLDSLTVDPRSVPLDKESGSWDLQTLRVTLPLSYRAATGGDTGYPLMCPPGTTQECLRSGGFLVRDTRSWELKGARTDVTTALGHAGIPSPVVDELLGCPGKDGVVRVASYRITADRPVTVARSPGRYIEATLSCPDGTTRQMRRWSVPAAHALIDASGRTAAVDRAVATAEIVD
jgi:hypothetical protein